MSHTRPSVFVVCRASLSYGGLTDDKRRSSVLLYFRNQIPLARQHLFVGSGVIEAGCKTVIGSRLKQSGMFWTVRGANAIITLRCCHLNGRFEDYWEDRRVA